MEEVLKGIWIAVGTILLCLALSITFSGDRNLNRVVNQQKEKILDQPVVYEDYQEKNNKNNSDVSYEEIIASLLDGIEYPVKIEEISLDPENFEPETFDFSLISYSNYKRTYVYNKNNKIELIRYKKVGENNG